MSNEELIEKSQTTAELRPRVQQLFLEGRYEEIYDFAQQYYDIANINRGIGRDRLFGFTVPLVLNFVEVPADTGLDEWQSAAEKEIGMPLRAFITGNASSSRDGLRKVIERLNSIQLASR